jgi:hypothetical protein
MRREARIAYEARGASATENEKDEGLRLVLRAREIDTGFGRTVHLSEADDRPVSTMLLLSDGLLRKLLAMARMTRPPPLGGRRPPRRRLDIRV